MIALTDERQIFIWGRRMGIYPALELTLDDVEKRGKIYNEVEID